ncbi:MAG: VTC domain-containing protein [Planctomycetota bacterium]|jgi:hypothetical protein
MLEDLLKRARGQKGPYALLKGSARPKRGVHHHRTGVGIWKERGRPIDRLVGCRYELKYRISESRAEAIRQFIKPYLHLDRYCKLQPAGTYPIATLYLDSENLQLCRESMEGKKNRFKLRIRSYTDDPNYPYFFEIKRRLNVIIIKSRHRVMHRDVAPLLSGLSMAAQNYDADGEMLKQFQLYMNSINAKPLICVRYMRQAYEDDSCNRVRITFDRDLAYKVDGEPNVSLSGVGWQLHSRRGVILEIKFTARYPAWLNQMVKCFDLRQQSISKYVSSVKEACSLKFGSPMLWADRWTSDNG